jgi:SOS-response transcriptional repressor LexA
VLDFIGKFIKENCISPSYQDICDGVGIKSKSNVHYIIKGLEYLGYIERIDGKNRTLKLSKNYTTRKLKQENQNLKKLLHKCKFDLIGHYTDIGWEDWSLINEIDNAIGEK